MAPGNEKSEQRKLQIARTPNSKTLIWRKVLPKKKKQKRSRVTKELWPR